MVCSGIILKVEKPFPQPCLLRLAPAEVVEPLSYWKWIETFYSNNKGLIWFGGILIAIVSAVLHFLIR
jgi:hypothetical protein